MAKYNGWKDKIVTFLCNIQEFFFCNLSLYNPDNIEFSYFLLYNNTIQHCDVQGSVDIHVGSAVNTSNVHIHNWLLLGRTDGSVCESARVAVVPDSRSVAVLVVGHCSGFSRRSGTPLIPKGRKIKCMKDQVKTT